MKKIIFISNNSWNIYNFRYDLINELSNQYKIIVCSSIDKYSKLIINNNIKIEKFELKKTNYNFISNFKYLIKLFFLIRKENPEYILSFTIKPNIFSCFISIFTKTKVIANITGLGSTYLSSNFINKIIFFFYKCIVSNAFHIFFQNNDDRNIFLGLSNNRKQSNSIVPGSGIKLENFNLFGVKKEMSSFLFVGRIIEHKGILELLNAISIIKKKNIKLNFVIIGDIDDKNPSKLSKKIFDKWIKLNIFKYYRFNDNISNFIKECQCLILPSYREGCSRVIMEAMSFGKPIITTDVPGCNNLVVDQYNGYLVKPKNQSDLAETILKFIKLKYEDKNRMGMLSRKIIEESFRVEFVIEKYMKIINQK